METDVTLHLNPADVQRFAQQYVPGADHLLLEAVRLGTGWLEADVRIQGLGLQVPVTLQATPGVAAGGYLPVAVALLRPHWIPRALQQKALELAVGAFDLTGVRYQAGAVRLDLAALQQEIGFAFEWQGLTITPEQVTVRLSHVQPIGADDATAGPAPRSAAGTAAAAPGSVALTAEPAASRTGTADDHSGWIPPDAKPEERHFYARLRERLAGWGAANLPGGLQRMLPWVLLVPDLFVLIVRLGRDPRVPMKYKALLALAAAYLLSPLDLIPDVLPVVGQLDDLSVAVYVIQELLQGTPPEVIQEHWPGAGDVLETVQSAGDWLSRHAGRGLLKRVRQLLARWRTGPS